MPKQLQNSHGTPRTIGADPLNTYALQDFLEMRTGLTEKKRRGLLKKMQGQLDLSGKVRTLPAFMIGAHAVLCIKEAAPETYWVYNPKRERLSSWKEAPLAVTPVS